MTDSWMFGFISAVWLGIMTSISPCPLATNIAAISFIGRKVKHPAEVLMAGLLYTAGRAFSYLVMAALIIAGLLSTPALSRFLQENMNKILGPVLIIAGMFLLELISFGRKGFDPGAGFRERIEKRGVWGALPLGMIFALSLCPISAAFFFGSLIPLSIKYGSAIVLPSLYGIGTAIPVLIFAFLLAFGAHSVSKAFNRLNRIEKWTRLITGTVFILAGIYYVLVHIFGLSFLWG